MKVLTDREKTIVSMAYGYGYTREYKDKEIGAALGLTSERIRQLRHGAVKKLRSAYLAASEA
jgi:DNA-directed RNA polymerase sigma subunit (sigma70/sigma32)